MSSRPDLHPLLQRQLRRAGLDAQALDHPAVVELLERVSRSYSESDQSRYLVERSQQVVSEEMSQLHAELEASQARLKNLLSLSSDWVWEQDAEFRFTYVSTGLLQLGIDVADLLGQRAKLRDLPQVLGHDPTLVEGLIAARQPFRNFVYGVRRRDGTPLYVRASGEPCFEHGVFAGYRGVATDVTETIANALELERLARFDNLTGLPNRAQFVQRLDEALLAAGEAGQSLAVLFVDLDRFKIVNDSLGHFCGDELLRVMASRLEGLVRGGDLVGRHGGDEFVVMARGPFPAEGLADLASRLLAALQEPMRLNGHPVQVSGSIGIARFPEHGSSSGDLIKHADEAMYRAKSRGQNRYEFFSQDLAQRTAESFLLETELRQAIPAGELRLHYQPKFNTRTGELCGMEALVRWQHPQRGLLAPGQFIQLAEETGLIVPMGRWLLRDAGRQLRRWQRLGLRVPRCALNLSPRQFLGDSVFEEVCSMLQDSGLQPSALELEITEGLLISDVASVQSELGRLHALGVHLTVDDFGTGYSSLAYLKRFPVGTLKLDRSFVSGLPDDKDDVAISRAVLAMAHSLGLGVVAEGVETQTQLQTLKELGCDEVQGYLLGRPMPAEQFQALLDRSAEGLPNRTPDGPERRGRPVSLAAAPGSVPV